MTSQGQRPSDVLLPSRIQRTLPHRYPFLLVDRVVEFVPAVRIAATKVFSANDAALQGHFPKSPIVPAGILIEVLTQLGAILVLEQPQMAGKIALILGIPSAQMLEPVRPGETLRLEAEVTKLRTSYGELRGRVTREGKLVAEGQMRFGVANAANFLPQ
jgi:3-hydroxyacyl-[acyl-carrier-protein] dehydratase